jgi:hypothetical protein
MSAESCNEMVKTNKCQQVDNNQNYIYNDMSCEADMCNFVVETSKNEGVYFVDDCFYKKVFIEKQDYGSSFL